MHWLGHRAGHETIAVVRPRPSTIAICMLLLLNFPGVRTTCRGVSRIPGRLALGLAVRLSASPPFELPLVAVAVAGLAARAFSALPAVNTSAVSSAAATRLVITGRCAFRGQGAGGRPVHRCRARVGSPALVGRGLIR